MSSVKRSLELFYIDGKPDGMLTAEIFDWTGHVLAVPRSRLAEALKRPEMTHTGVYILLGEKNNEPWAYIGEAEELRARLRQHAQDSRRGWWEKAVLMTTTDNRLNKGYGRYLEARLIQRARETGRVILENGTTPPTPVLREAEQAKMEGFLDNLFMVLPALRVDIFIENARPAGSTRKEQDASSENTTYFELYYPKHDIRATAVFQHGDFIVEASSEAYPEWQGSLESNYRDLYEELLRSDVLVRDGEKAVFAKDYVFSSPSAAGAIVFGRSVNGPTHWKLKGQKTTYKDWEKQILEKVVS